MSMGVVGLEGVSVNGGATSVGLGAWISSTFYKALRAWQSLNNPVLLIL